MIAIGLALIPGYGRLVRGAVLAARAQDYVLAARALGARDSRIMFSHILPNIIPPVIVFATLGLGSAILIVGGLSFIGLGVNPPAPEWGAMLLYARDKLRQAPWLSFYPGAAIFVTGAERELVGGWPARCVGPEIEVAVCWPRIFAVMLLIEGNRWEVLCAQWWKHFVRVRHF